MNACEIVTSAEVTSALGAEVMDGTNAPANVPNVCNFSAVGGQQVSRVLYEQGGEAMLPMMMPQPTDVPGDR